MRRILILCLSFTFLMATADCLYAVRYDGEYTGKIIDTETGEPLSGVIVLGVWLIGNMRIDAMETVTDEMGEFSISADGIKKSSSIAIVIYKSGYETIGDSWEQFEKRSLSEKYKLQDGKPIIPLKKLTEEQKRRSFSSAILYLIPASIPLEKMKLLAKEIDKERAKAGLKPWKIESEYAGKVIDAETGKPLKGVVVLGTWHTMTVTLDGTAHHFFYDARETVTDENGEFRISGEGLKVVTNLEPMRVMIFKAGYQYEEGGWNEGNSFYEGLTWEGDKANIPLKKLTMEERRKQGTPDFYIGKRYDEKENITHSCLPKNIKLLPKEVNKELLEQGRKPYDLEGGRCEK